MNSDAKKYFYLKFKSRVNFCPRSIIPSLQNPPLLWVAPTQAIFYFSRGQPHWVMSLVLYSQVSHGEAFILQKANWRQVYASFFKVRSLVLLERGMWRKWQRPSSRREFGCSRCPFGRSFWKTNSGPRGLLLLCRGAKKENPIWRSKSCKMVASSSLGPTNYGWGSEVRAPV